MTVNDAVFKAFNDFGVDDLPARAEISRRMLRRLEDIDNAATAGPTTPTARGAWHPVSSHTPWSNSRPHSWS